MRIQQEGACYESRRGPSPEYDHSHTLILDFPDSRTMQNTCLLFISYSVSNILLEQSEWTKTVYTIAFFFPLQFNLAKQAVIILRWLPMSCVHAWSLSHIQLFATPWTVACQAPLSMEFSRQENWSGLPFPPPDPGIKPASLVFLH